MTATQPAVVVFAAIYGALAGAEAGGFDAAPLLNVGAIGVVLAWLMWRVEPRMKANEAATDRNTRATLLLLIEIPAIAEAVKEQAQNLVAECDDAAKKREGK